MIILSLVGCEPSYEELKPEPRWNSEQVWLWLRAFLWGIETQAHYKYQQYEQPVASLPMRNWNLIFQFPMLVMVCIVASLPMRNWNLMSKTQSNYFQSVASLPMRNWNFSFSETSFFPRIGCEPSYEELKHRGNLGNPLTVFGCEPSYEELKHIKELSLFDLYQVGCEPSYEELKLKREFIISSLQLVASLPMRNWNQVFLPKH